MKNLTRLSKYLIVLGFIVGPTLAFAQSCYTIFNTAARQTTSAGFVWKPISEGDGRLVVLFPASSGATGATLRFGGATIAVGRFSGRTNGNRPTIRFGAPGGAYPNGLQVCEAGGGSPPPPTPTPAPAPRPAPPPPPPEPEPDLTPILNILME